MPSENTGQGAAAPQNTGVNSGGASPSSSTSVTTARSPAIRGTENNSSSQRLSSEQLFQEYGEDIFKHDRFKELSGYKQKWESLEPIVQTYGGVEELGKFNEFLGPVWQAFNQMQPEKAQAAWSKLLPVFQALIEQKEIDPFFAAQAAAAVSSATGGDDEDDPAFKKVTELETKVENLYKTQAQKEEAEMRRRTMESAKINQDKYESRFVQEATQAGIPEEAMVFLGDIVINRLQKYMPKNPKTGLQVHPLAAFNEEALLKCFNTEVLPAYRAMSKAAVTSAVSDSGPALPQTNGNGQTVSGVPANRHARNARFAQFLQTGR